jgi:hypothetical protein
MIPSTGIVIEFKNPDINQTSDLRISSNRSEANECRLVLKTMQEAFLLGLTLIGALLFVMVFVTCGLIIAFRYKTRESKSLCVSIPVK